ncbi:WD40 repeat domain-containing protein [Thiothrix subterranea]|nr:WD40 repeat domain-containing protein [Thiothrix subterranea]QQZ30204.1 WD40 repeat domain-containing protein [Thiothrix subterranea]
MEDSITAWRNGVSGSLLREKRLAEAHQVLEQYPDSLLIGADERGFITASAKAAKRRQHLQWTAIVAFIGVFLVGILTTLWQANEKEQQRELAVQQKEEAEQRTLEANYNLAKVFEEKVFQLIPDKVIRGEALADPMQMRTAWLYGLDAAAQAVSEGKEAVLPATLGHLSAIREQDLSTERKQIPSLNIGAISELVYSPDGKVIASGSEDKTMRLWDAATGKEMKTLSGHSLGVSALAYSPDGKVIASGSGDMTVRLWDAATGQVLNTLSGHSLGVSALAYSPDGKVIASGSGDKTIRLWNAATGQMLNTLSGHTNYVSTLAYSPDSKMIASGSGDKTMRLWDASSGDTLKTLQGHTAPIRSVAYSPDGKVIASGSEDKTVRLWKLDSPIFRLIYDFDPAAVSATLRFIWEMQRDELQIKSVPHPCFLNWVITSLGRTKPASCARY